MRQCIIVNCQREVVAKNLCGLHYDRERYNRRPATFRSDNLRRAMITDEDARQLERILSHLPAK